MWNLNAVHLFSLHRSAIVASVQVCGCGFSDGYWVSPVLKWEVQNISSFISAFAFLHFSDVGSMFWLHQRRITDRRAATKSTAF